MSSQMTWNPHLLGQIKIGVSPPGSYCNQFCSVQSLSHVRLFATLWTVACQAFLSSSNTRSPPKPMSIQSVMPSNHLILCRPFLLLPSIFPSIRVFSNESAPHESGLGGQSIGVSTSTSVLSKVRSPCSPRESKGLSRVFYNTTVQKYQFFCTQLSL